MALVKCLCVALREGLTLEYYSRFVNNAGMLPAYCACHCAPIIFDNLDSCCGLPAECGATNEREHTQYLTGCIGLVAGGMYGWLFVAVGFKYVGTHNVVSSDSPANVLSGNVVKRKLEPRFLKVHTCNETRARDRRPRA